MANRLPIPRIERRSRDSLLWTADDEGRYPRVVDSAHQLTAEEADVCCAIPGAWHDGTQVHYTREGAETALIWARWGEDRDVPVIDRRKTR